MKLLFVHGSGSSGEDFHYQTRHFKDSEAVTLPGHPHGKACKTIEEYVEWVRGFIAGKEYKNVVLAGHSMGGAIVLMYAFKYPEELRGVICLSTGARLRVHPMYLNQHHNGMWDRKAWEKEQRSHKPSYDPSVADKVREKRLVNGPGITYNDYLACDHFDLLNRVSEVKVPTLALCGSEDIETFPMYTEYLGKNMPNCRAVIIPGATHEVILEKPREVNQAIEQFLATLA